VGPPKIMKSVFK